MLKKTIWELNRPTVQEYLLAEKLPLVVVLDNVRSLNNVGSIFRTSDALGVGEVLLCGITATPPSAEIHKTALGAEESVRWRYFDTTIECMEALRQQGYVICALEQVNGSVSLPEFRPVSGQKYAIVVGHEVDGVAQEVVNMSDVCIEIPQSGTKHSLNVAVSAALAIWHFSLNL